MQKENTIWAEADNYIEKKKGSRFINFMTIMNGICSRYMKNQDIYG